MWGGPITQLVYGDTLGITNTPLVPTFSFAGVGPGGGRVGTGSGKMRTGLCVCACRQACVGVLREEQGEKDQPLGWVADC